MERTRGRKRLIGTLTVRITMVTLKILKMKLKKKTFAVLLLVIFFPWLSVNIIHATPSLKSKNNNNQWHISGRTGTAWLQYEIGSDMALLKKEFTHQPGLAIDLGISRTLGRSWEPGILISIFRLSGESDLPEFSANGNHSSFITLYQMPVEYVTVSTSLSAYCRYHFRSFSKRTTTTVSLNPFAELGGGINYFFTQLGYQTTPEGENSSIIFRKGTGEKPRTQPGNVAQISLGLGTKIEMPRNLTLIFSLNTDIINYDCLDAVHNYTDGKRNHASSVVPRIMAGVCVPIGNKGRSGGGDSHLPWAR